MPSQRHISCLRLQLSLQVSVRQLAKKVRILHQMNIKPRKNGLNYTDINYGH